MSVKLEDRGLRHGCTQQHAGKQRLWRGSKALKQKMQQLSGQEFEGVLHPVFQEDELTLILVGAFLGMVAGFAQAAFF